jgi:hypothetical protein
MSVPKQPGVSVNPKTYAIIQAVAKKNQVSLGKVLEYLVEKGAK